MRHKKPEHLEPDPGRREKFCPVSIHFQSENPRMTIPELQAAIIASTNASQALKIFYNFCGSFGVNSNAPPEWWTKKEELTDQEKPA